MLALVLFGTSQRLLVESLDQLDAERGPVDKALIEKYVGLLG